MGDIKDYKIIKALGHGRTSSVYLAEHPQYGQVALKCLHPEARYVVIPDGRLVIHLFMQEQEILLGLQAAFDKNKFLHTPIPKFFETSGEYSTTPYLAISVAPGTPVDELLREDKYQNGLPEPMALEIISQFAQLLHVLHTELRRTYTDMQIGNLFWKEKEDGLLGEGDLTVIDWNVVSKPFPLLGENPTPEQSAEEKKFKENVQRDVTLAIRFLFRLLTNRIAPDGGVSLQELGKLEKWLQLSRGTRNFIAEQLSLDPTQIRCSNAETLKDKVSDLSNRWRRVPTRTANKLKTDYETVKDKLEWALEVDEWLPIFKFHQLELDPVLLRELTSSVAQLVVDPLTAINKGRSFLDGKDYQQAHETFKKVRQAGLGLQATRWQVLSQIGQEAKAQGTAVDSKFFDNLEKLKQAIIALEQGRWDDENLKPLPMPNTHELLTLHHYLVTEANIRAALERGDLIVAYHHENELNNLPDPLLTFSGEIYRKDLRAEIGDLKTLAASAQHKKAREDKRLEREKELNQATPDQWVDKLRDFYKESNNTTEWVQWALKKGNESADGGQFELACQLFDFALGYSYESSANSTNYWKQRRALGWLKDFAKWAADSNQYQELYTEADKHLPLFLVDEKRKKQLVEIIYPLWKADVTNAGWQSLLFRLDPNFNPDPAIYQNEQKTKAQELYNARKFYTAQSHLQATNVQIQPLQTNIEEAIGAETQKLNNFLNQSDYNQWLTNLKDWLQREPGQKELLELAASQIVPFITKGQFDLAQKLGDLIETSRQGLAIQTDSQYLPMFRGGDSGDLTSVQNLLTQDRLPDTLTEVAAALIRKALKSEIVDNWDAEMARQWLGLGLVLEQKGFKAESEKVRERQKIFLEKSLDKDVFFGAVQKDYQLWPAYCQYIATNLLPNPNCLDELQKQLTALQTCFPQEPPEEIKKTIDHFNLLKELSTALTDEANFVQSFCNHLGSSPEMLKLMGGWLEYWLKEQLAVLSGEGIDRLQGKIQEHSPNWPNITSILTGLKTKHQSQTHLNKLTGYLKDSPILFDEKFNEIYQNISDLELQKNAYPLLRQRIKQLIPPLVFSEEQQSWAFKKPLSEMDDLQLGELNPLTESPPPWWWGKITKAEGENLQELTQAWIFEQFQRAIQKNEFLFLEFNNLTSAHRKSAEDLLRRHLGLSSEAIVPDVQSIQAQNTKFQELKNKFHNAPTTFDSDFWNVYKELTYLRYQQQANNLLRERLQQLSKSLLKYENEWESVQSVGGMNQKQLDQLIGILEVITRNPLWQLTESNFEIHATQLEQIFQSALFQKAKLQLENVETFIRTFEDYHSKLKGDYQVQILEDLKEVFIGRLTKELEFRNNAWHPRIKLADFNDNSLTEWNEWLDEITSQPSWDVFQTHLVAQTKQIGELKTDIEREITNRLEQKKKRELTDLLEQKEGSLQSAKGFVEEEVKKNAFSTDFLNGLVEMYRGEWAKRCDQFTSNAKWKRRLAQLASNVSAG